MESEGSAFVAKRIVVCVGNDDESKQALKYYMENIHKDDNEVIILHIQEHRKIERKFTGGMFSAGIGVTLTISDDSPSEALNREAGVLFTTYQDLLDGYEAHYEFQTFPQKMNQSKGAMILSFAEEKSVSLIVMGSKKLGVIKKTIYGSTSDFIYGNSDIPVLFCPPKRLNQSKPIIFPRIRRVLGYL